MYAASPIMQDNGQIRPRVTVVDMTARPLQVFAAVSELYRGGIYPDPREVTREQAMEWYHGALVARGLPAPLEWVGISLYIEGVTRAFTHQMVRQRTATYVQESMRFAVKENAGMEVALPPSLMGTEGGQTLGAEDSTAEWQRNVWDEAVGSISQAYLHLVGSGIPAEDARGLLPTNIGTRIHYHTNLRSLIDHAGLRLCSQAQYEWKQVWAEIIRAILAYGPEEDRWQQEAIVRMFRPVCYQTGKCEFMGPADRHCDIRDRVEAHHAKGDRPEDWDDINPHEALRYGAARRP
jgi:flavin-dependent thymidylate synthase